MKLSVLAVTAAIVAALGAGPVLAQSMTASVTMQPIPNPPEKAKAPMHKAKHHKKAEAKKLM
jgi:hypothetical protein